MKASGTPHAAGAVHVALVRGGTSKGPFVSLTDVPADEERRRQWCMALMGTPDPMQLDGLGGTYSSTSKIMAVAPAATLRRMPWAWAQAEAASGDSAAEALAGCDLVSWFAQVGIDEPVVDWRGNCGNLTAGIVPFALHRRMLGDGGEEVAPLPDGDHTIRVFNINTATSIDVTLPVEDGMLAASGDFEMAGVPGTAARIDTKYLNPAGAVTGSTLPTGRPVDIIEVAGPRHGVAEHAFDGRLSVEVSIVDVSTPIVVVNPSEIGLPEMVTPAEVNADPRVLALLEDIRVAAARLAGIVDENGEPFLTVPRVALVTRSTARGAGGSVESRRDVYSGAEADGGRRADSSRIVGDRTVDAATDSNDGSAINDSPRLVVYSTSSGRVHHSLPGTVMLALAGAARVPGTLVHRAVAERGGTGMASPPHTSAAGAAVPNVNAANQHDAHQAEDVRITHPKGDVVVAAPNDPELPWVSLPRTARILMDGMFYLP